MAIVNFDAFGLYEIPDFILCQPDATPLYVLSAIADRKFSPRFNTFSELSFSAREYINGEKMPYYDYLINHRLVCIDGIGYFQIVENIEQGDGIETYKEIKCQSVEIQLVYKKMALLKGTYKFYDPIDPSGTLMQKIIDLIPDWSLGTIDAEIAVKYRTFDVTDTTIYNLLMSTIEEAYECVFVFDTIDKTISAYSLSNATLDTSIYISYDNVIKNIKIEEINDEYITSLTVLGGGDLSINQVNPLGTNNIYNFDYAKGAGGLIEDQGLIDAISSWENVISANQANYADILSNLSSTNAEKLSLQSELTLLQGELTALNNVLGAEIQGGQSHTETNIAIASKQSEIDNKKSQIEGTEARIAILTAELATINSLVSFDNNFTTDQIKQLQPFIIQSGYVNENFIQTDSMTNVEIQQQAQELYDQAVSMLSRISEPRYNFSVESINFPLIKLFESFTDELVMGCIINLEIKPNVISHPILLGFDLNYDNPEDFKLIFGNRLRLDDSSFQYSDLNSDSISSAITTNVNSTNWSDTKDYVNNTVSPFVTGALNAANNMVISGSAQNIILNENGLRGRQEISSGVYSPEQFWMVNNVLAFTDNNWQTSKLALGKIALPGGGTGFGLVSDYLVGTMVAGNNLVITNENNKFLVDGNGATLIDANLNITSSANTNQILLSPSDGIKIRSNVGGTWTDTFYADTSGNLHLKGVLDAVTGNFSGNITATNITGGTITGTTINGTIINGGSIYGTTGTFSGNIYAANLQGLVQDSQIASLTADKITAGTIKAVTINSSVINGTSIYGSNIYSSDQLNTVNCYVSNAVMGTNGIFGHLSISSGGITVNGSSGVSGTIAYVKAVSGGVATAWGALSFRSGIIVAYS